MASAGDTALVTGRAAIDTLRSLQVALLYFVFPERRRFRRARGDASRRASLYLGSADEVQAASPKCLVKLHGRSGDEQRQGNPRPRGQALCGDVSEINGQPRSLRLVFLNAWTQTPKGWKFIAWQSTPRPAT
jgi:hypothetical protein